MLKKQQQWYLMYGEMKTRKKLLLLLRSALVCLRGSRTLRRIQRDIKNADIDIETEEGAIWETPILLIYFYLFFLSF